MSNTPDVKIIFSVRADIVGEMESSFTSLDSSLHIIPQDIVKQISNADSVEISFSVNNGKTVEKLDKLKLIEWMYENCMFSLRAADLLTAEINKGTFTIT